MNNSITTVAGELGQISSEAIKDLIFHATGNSNIATYAEGQSPLSWDLIAEGGWDQIGIVEDGDGATLRDLVDVARTWGRACIQLPLLATILAKRHSVVARGIDGPVTLALPSATLPSGTSYIPFGQDTATPILAGLGSEAESLTNGQLEAVTDTLAITLRGLEAKIESTLSPVAAREIAVVLAAEAVGAAERMLDDAVAFAQERKQFGKPIGSFQAVKHHLANALIAVEMGETATIWASTQEEEAFRGATFAVNQAIKAAELALQVHGGLGFTWEMGLHFYLRHMLAVRELIQGLREQHA